MWPPFILITSSTLLHIESMSFLHIPFTSGSRNQTCMTLSIIIIFVVQFILRIRALIMAYKLSIGFKSGEFPGQSSNLKFSIHKNDFVTLEVGQGAKSCWNTPKPPGYLLRMVGISLVLITSMYFVLFISPSIVQRVSGPNSVEQPQNMTFGGCLGACWMWPDLIGSSDKRRKKFDLYPCTSKWVSSEKITFLHCSTVQSLYFFAQDNLFFFTRGVKSCFLIGRRALRPHSRRRRRTVEASTSIPWGTTSLFMSLLVFFGSMMLILRIRASSLGAVFLFAPQCPFLHVFTPPVSLCNLTILDTLDLLTQTTSAI